MAILQSDFNPTAQCDLFAKEFGKVSHSLLDTLSFLPPGNQGSSPNPLADSFQFLSLATLSFLPLKHYWSGQCWFTASETWFPNNTLTQTSFHQPAQRCFPLAGPQAPQAWHICSWTSLIPWKPPLYPVCLIIAHPTPKFGHHLSFLSFVPCLIPQFCTHPTSWSFPSSHPKSYWFSPDPIFISLEYVTDFQLAPWPPCNYFTTIIQEWSF